jgi:hypothetical protein
LYNDGTHGDQVAGDSIFTTMIGSSFAAGREERLYYIKYYAVDSLDEINENVPITSLYLENGPARIDSILMPDTLTRPDDKLTFQIEVFTYDPQGSKDIESVFFQTIKPDGSYSGIGSSGSFFDLQDNGDSFYGDEDADDGIFSKKVQLEKNNDPGTYTFLFYLRPKIGQDLGPVIDSIIVE